MKRLRMGLALVLATAAQWLLRGLEPPAEDEPEENPEPDISPKLALAMDYPSENVIEILEEMLAEAKTGELRAIWGFGLYPSGGYGFGANLGLDIPELLGHIELAKHELLHRIMSEE